MQNPHQGTDDVLAHLLAFSAKPEEIEVLLVSVTFGNVDVQLSAPSLLPLPPFTLDTIEQQHSASARLTPRYQSVMLS